MAAVKWERSKDGFCKSKCGRFRIKPIFAGRVKPIWYQVEDNDPDNPGVATLGTHRDCRGWVERRKNPPAHRSDWVEITAAML